MKRFLKFICFLMTALVGWFSPLQTTALEAQGMCCAECALKKEDEIEVVINEEENKDD